MKLRASRPNRDFEDIAVLVRACGFTTVAECTELVDDFYLREEEIPGHERRPAFRAPRCHAY